MNICQIMGIILMMCGLLIIFLRALGKIGSVADIEIKELKVKGGVGLFVMAFGFLFLILGSGIIPLGGVISLGGIIPLGDIIPLCGPVTPTPTSSITPTEIPPRDFYFPDVIIKITNPQKGAEVSSPLTVEGTIERELPEDWYLWMFYYNYEEWYPQYRIVPFEGEWQSKAWLGSVTNVERDVVVVLGNEDADSKFQQAQGEPLSILPQGAKIFDQITVIVREI